MRFMYLVKADKNHEAGKPPDPKLMEAVQKLADEAVQAGTIVLTGGLAPSSQGVRLQASGGELTEIDGPFAETKELVGGFAVFELASKAEAIEHGRRFMKVHQEILGPTWDGRLEIRQVFGTEDFRK